MAKKDKYRCQADLTQKVIHETVEKLPRNCGKLFLRKFTIDKKKNRLTQKNEHKNQVKNTSKKETDLTHDPTHACCFTGHRDLPQNLIPQLRAQMYAELEKLYSFFGVKTFISGGAIGFDLLAAETVLELKRAHPEIKLIFALPCENHTKNWGDAATMKFRMLSLLADNTVYVSQNYYNGCMHVRNKFMLEHSEFCICYCKKTSGGSYYTLCAAKKMNKTIIEL